MLNKKFILIFGIIFLFAGNSFAQTAFEPIINTEIKDGVNDKITIDKIDKSNFDNIAILQGLNKITAKTSEFEVKVGGKIEFGKLTIIIDKCWQAPLDQRPESKILMDVCFIAINFRA